MAPGGYLLVRPQNTGTDTDTGTDTGTHVGNVSALLRTADTAYHSPRGICVTTVVLSTCARSAICRSSAGLVARRTVSMLSSHGQPARAWSQVTAREGVMSGSRMSTWTQLLRTVTRFC